MCKAAPRDPNVPSKDTEMKAIKIHEVTISSKCWDDSIPGAWLCLAPPAQDTAPPLQVWALSPQPLLNFCHCLFIHLLPLDCKLCEGWDCHCSHHWLSSFQSAMTVFRKSKRANKWHMLALNCHNNSFCSHSNKDHQTSLMTCSSKHCF